MSESIVLFSGKNLDNFQQEGGVGAFKFSQERANHADYLLVVRSHSQT